MGNERKLSVAESWRLALVDPTHRGEGAVGTVFAEIQSLAGRPVETRTCDRPEPADLALVDIMMPGEDGISLCRHLVESRNLPVIFLTAKGEATDRIVGLEIGAEVGDGGPDRAES